VLGNPTAYEILKILSKSKKTPTELSEDIGLSLKTISETLRNLRQINLVRYTTEQNWKIYFIKDKFLLNALQHIEQYVEKMRVKKW